MKHSLYKILYSLLTVLLFLSCAGETYYVNIDDIPNWDKGDTTRYFTVVYTARVGTNIYNESQSKGVYTPDTIVFPANRYVHMYIYQENQTPETAQPFAFSILKSDQAGSLTPISAQYELKLPAGTYNAYAMSELNTTDNNQLTFINGNGTGGEMDGFANGLDFLWWKQENIIVSELSNAPVRVVFNQISTHIQLNVYAGEGQEIVGYYSGDISTPQPGECTLQLATGQVVPSTTVSSTQRTSFTISNNSYYVNLVPFKASGTLLVKINVQVAHGYTGWKDVYLPVPEGGEFKQGNAYIYNLYYDNPTKQFQVDPVQIIRTMVGLDPGTVSRES